MSQGIMHGDLVCKLNEELLRVREELRQALVKEYAPSTIDQEFDKNISELWGKDREELLRVRAENARLLAERDAAIHEANRRDQKWMDGINEAVGRKLDYGDPCSRDNASKALNVIAIDLQRHKSALEKAREALTCCDAVAAGAAIQLHRGMINEALAAINEVLSQ